MSNAEDIYNLFMLRQHLLKVHRNQAAPELDGPQAWDAHFHEHTGPGGLRNHEHDAAQPILMMTASLDRELFPSEYVANQVDVRMKAQPVITDWRDGVERACDNFDPQAHDAIPLGRGRTFTEFHDIGRSRLRVILSSSAMRECCRVLIEPAEEYRVDRPTPGGMVHPHVTDSDLHLCRCMAAELVRALNEAYDNTLQSQPRCDSVEEPPVRTGPRFFLSVLDKTWVEVSRDRWIRAERQSGFNGPIGELATAGFGNGVIKGRMTFDGSEPEGALLRLSEEDSDE
jgi:hypothetical protein